jgi:hypothetical protein
MSPMRLCYCSSEYQWEGQKELPIKNKDMWFQEFIVRTVSVIFPWPLLTGNSISKFYSAWKYANIQNTFKWTNEAYCMYNSGWEAKSPKTTYAMTYVTTDGKWKFCHTTLWASWPWRSVVGRVLARWPIPGDNTCWRYWSTAHGCW